MIFTISKIISPLRKVWPFIWTILNPLHTMIPCAKFGWNWLSGSGKEDFWKSSIYFYYFPIISPLGRAWFFIWTNLNPLHQGILCAKFGRNWLSGSGEDDENVKSLQTDGQTDRQTDRQTDDGRPDDPKSSGELKTVHKLWEQTLM